MLDQSFSLRNFREIYDSENRKGNCLETMFAELKGVYDITNKIKISKGIIKTETKREEKRKIYKCIKDLKSKKETILDECLISVEKQIQSDGLKLRLKNGPVVLGKQTYTVEKSLSNFLFAKQTQKNLVKVFRVKPSVRNEIIAQLKAVLSDGLHKVIVKTDIKEFYESIPHKELLAIIESNKLLSVISKKYIRDLLEEYKKIGKRKSVGIPRGIGVSAYLSEIYMRRLDECLKKIPGLIYYSRYVDDIVMVFGYEPTMTNAYFKEKIKSVCEELGLKYHDKKTKILQVDKGKKSESFEFLGYRIIFNTSSADKETYIDFDLSDKKKQKLQNRVKKSFEQYNRAKNKRTGGHLLYNRIRFLTSNTKLVNNKNNIVVGIYCSNKFLTKKESLEELDSYLYGLSDLLKDKKMSKKLKDLSFFRGWKEKTYHKHSSNALKRITEIWHHDENC